MTKRKGLAVVLGIAAIVASAWAFERFLRIGWVMMQEIEEFYGDVTTDDIERLRSM